jgi:drug/metabolite transporter (DMT)-like permease
MSQQSNPALNWLLLITLGLIWGSSFILMKRGLVDFSADQVAAIRMFASFLFLLPFVITRIKEIHPPHWKFIFATGLLGNGIPAFLFAYAQTVLPSFMAGLLNSLTPVFTLAIGYFIFQTEVTFNKVAGVLLGLAGAVGLILSASPVKTLEASWYPFLIVIATICYALSVNTIRHKLHEVDSILISGFALWIAGPPSGIYLFSTNFTQILSQNPHSVISLTYVLLLALFGTAISIVLFNRLIKLSGALFASSVTYLIPIVALMWGLADQESINFYHIIGLAAILGGVYLINLKKNTQPS